MEPDSQPTPDAMWQEVMRIDAPPISDAYMEATTHQLFGGLWARPGMARRDRRLTTLTVIATRGLREPLIGHLSAAMSSGDLTAEELHEWVLHVAYYAGWPAGANAYAALREVLAHPTSAG